MHNDVSNEIIDVREVGRHLVVLSLVAFMLECATAGQWGRARATSHWAQISSYKWLEYTEQLRTQWEVGYVQQGHVVISA